MKKIICCLIIILTFLCGCDKKPEKVEDNTEVLIESTSEVTGGHYVDPNADIGIYQNIYKVKREENGNIKYSSFLGDSISFDGNKIELAMDMCITSGKDLNGMMEAMVLMVIDEQLIPFTMEDSKEAFIHRVKLENTVTSRKLISFSVNNFQRGEEKEWAILLVPLLEEYAHVPDEVAVGVCNKKIMSSVDGTDIVEKDFCFKGYFYDTVQNLYGKRLFDICPYNGAVLDYILQSKDGKWYYTLDSRNSETLVVMLFCDGELYDGFNGKSSLYIENTVEQQQVHMEIDTSRLAAGEHKMMAVVLVYDEEGKLDMVRKSLVGNINIVK